MNDLYSILNKIFYIAVDLLKNWSFVFLIVVIIFQKQIKDLISKLDSLKFSKEGLELQKTAREAKETLNDIQELAITMYIPVLDMLSKTGRLCGAPTIEERLSNRDMILKFIEKHDIKDSKIMQKIDGINNSILFDVLHSMIDNLNGTSNVSIYSEICKLFNSNPKGTFICNPDMPAIKDKLIAYELMDDTVEYIFSEVENFIKHKQFKNLSKLKECMKLKSRYPDDEL